MKSIYLSILIILCAAISATAQTPQYLTSEYSIANFGDKTIKPHYVIKHAFAEKPLPGEIAVLKQGDYVIDNEVYFEFHINEKGLMHGDAKYRSKKSPNFLTTLEYDNGILIKSQTLNTATNSVLSETVLNDSVLTATHYYESGQVQEVEITDCKIKDNAANNIRTTYYENGQIEKESNKIAQTFSTFSENGNPKRFVDNKNGIWISYNKDGTKESHSYRNGDEACMERYAREVIILKECTSDKESKTYRYENGKMTYVEVYNRQTRQTTFFDAKGKPLKDKTPEPIISIGL